MRSDMTKCFLRTIMFFLSHFEKQRQNNYLEIILPRGGVTTLQFCGEIISTELPTNYTDFLESISTDF